MRLLRGPKEARGGARERPSLEEEEEEGEAKLGRGGAGGGKEQLE